MPNAVMEANHGLMQSVGVDSPVLAALIAEGRFNIDAPENLLFLSRNAQLAEATNTARHAGNHRALFDAQMAIFEDVTTQPPLTPT
jgi:hypothetical protein